MWRVPQRRADHPFPDYRITRCRHRFIGFSQGTENGQGVAPIIGPRVIYIRRGRRFMTRRINAEMLSRKYAGDPLHYRRFRHIHCLSP